MISHGQSIKSGFIYKGGATKGGGEGIVRYSTLGFSFFLDNLLSHSVLLEGGYPIQLLQVLGSAPM